MENKAPERIAIPDLEEKIETVKTLMIVDVRTPAEIQESGAVPNAVHIPVDQVDQHLNDFPKAGEVAFYCGGGGSGPPAPLRHFGMPGIGRFSTSVCATGNDGACPRRKQPNRCQLKNRS